MEQIKENNNRFFALLAVLLISIASFLFVNNYVLADDGNADEGGYSEEYYTISTSNNFVFHCFISSHRTTACNTVSDVCFQ